MQFDAAGINEIDNSWDGARRSFWAMLLTLPAFIILNWIAWRQPSISGAAPRAGLATTIVVEAIVYTLQWTVLPVLAFHLCTLWRRAGHYPRLVTAFNWLTLWQSLISVVLALIASTGVFPMPVLNWLATLAVIYLFAVEGFAARLALQVGALGAIGIVGLDLVVTWQISTLRMLLLAH